jgi:hypothetical protein
MEGSQLGTAAGQSGAKIYSAAKLWDTIFVLPTTQQGILFGHGGEHMRNLVFTIPNTPPEGPSLNHIVGFRRWTSTRLEEPVYLYSSTITDRRSQANAPSRSFSLTNASDPRAALLNTANLVLHAPNGISGGPTSDAPIDGTSAWTPLYLGRRISTENSGETQTQFAHAPADAPIARPLTGSAAIGDATGDLVTYRDAYGTVRPSPASRGAVEPSA